MVSVTERGSQKMESSSAHRGRLVVAVQADGLFGDYEIEMPPSEALAFAGVIDTAEGSTLARLIERINVAIPPVDFGPEHPQTGKLHHHFRVGREGAGRLIKIEIFKGFFQVDYDFIGLLELVHSLGAEAGAQVAVDAGNNSYAINMRWKRSDE